MEDFTPAVQSVAQTSEMKATAEFAKVAGDRRLITFMQKNAQLSLFLPFKKIETQAQYDQAIDAFNTSKETIKSLEEFRHSSVDYPTKLVKMINGLFKQIRDGLEGSKAHLGKIINDKKMADEEIARIAAEAAAEKAKEGTPEVIDDGDGVGTVQMDGGVVAPPSNVVESARGAKVHTRKDTEVTVVDLKLFLKTLSSKNKRYSWFVDEAENLVEIKTGALKRLLKENKGKKIPGIETSTVTVTI